jgi:hypothetical protein
LVFDGIATKMQELFYGSEIFEGPPEGLLACGDKRSFLINAGFTDKMLIISSLL